MNDMRSQTVLVIGAEGFIGQHTLRHLLPHHTVYATHIPTQTPPAIEGVRWLACDLTDAAAPDLWPAVCDSVIYLAQSQQWRRFPAGVLDMLHVNVDAPLRAAEYARRAGAARLIFASSGSVYTQTARPARETDAFDLHAPRDFYHASKLAAELLLGPYAALFEVVLLRFFMPYGVGQSQTMLIPSLVRRVRTGQPISLHGQDGLLSNPVAVADVAETLGRCLTLGRSVTLNVAGPDVLTLRAVGECIGRVLGIAPRFETHPDQTPPVIVGDTAHLKDVLGWAPETRFEAGLRAWLHKGAG